MPKPRSAKGGRVIRFYSRKGEKVLEIRPRRDGDGWVVIIDPELFERYALYMQERGIIIMSGRLEVGSQNDGRSRSNGKAAEIVRRIKAKGGRRSRPTEADASEAEDIDTDDDDNWFDLLAQGDIGV